MEWKVFTKSLFPTFLKPDLTGWVNGPIPPKALATLPGESAVKNDVNLSLLSIYTHSIRNLTDCLALFFDVALAHLVF